MALTSPRLLMALATLLLGLAGQEAWRLVRIHEWNEEIAHGGAKADGPPAPPSVRFAAAFALAKKGDVQAALNLYRELESGNDAQIRADAKFNSANLYFEQSLALRVSADPSRALTLVELAKQSYRELLRDHSDDWDARYNLERALRVAPDPEQDTQGLPPPPGARRTPTTVRAESMGLP